MKERRKRTDYVLEQKDRHTIREQIGGALYDFIDNKYLTPKPESKTESKTERKIEYLTVIMNETGMNRETLKRIFKGKNDSFDQYYRLKLAIADILPKEDYDSLNIRLSHLEHAFAHDHGDAFQDEQRRLHRPRRRPP